MSPAFRRSVIRGKHGSNDVSWRTPGNALPETRHCRTPFDTRTNKLSITFRVGD